LTEYLHRPANPSGVALVLTHGAGANAQSSLLIKTAEAFTTVGFYVLRYNLPFRQRKPFGPPSPATAQQDREGLRDAVNRMREFAPTVCLGGHSYGGRQASMLAAEDKGLAAALLLLSYPLHPPKKPEQLRTAHFPQLETSALFIHGTKDPFGTPTEMTAALRLIPAKTQLQIFEGAAHDLVKSASYDSEKVVSLFTTLIQRH
jgi:predicted alpha/beta-hydrolase family hydrolase